MSNRNTFRHGDTMIAVESTPAIVAFDDLLAATRVIEDTDNCEAPWVNWDGWEHIAKPAVLFDNPRERLGYCRFADGSDHYVIELPAGEDYGVYKYARERGASRQVAAETVAAERRRTLAQLVNWYEDGWQWYGVRCRFTVLGDEYEASLWGIDDAEYAERDIKVEMALDVAGQLEKAGFTVTGKPEHGPGFQRLSRADKQERIRRNLAAQNWAA
jgi:hypothetical protein